MPRLSFIYPEMLWLLPLLAGLWALALAIPRRLSPTRFGISLGLRSLIMLALILAAAGTQLVLPVQRLTTVFLIDASDSVSPSARAQAETLVAEALEAMPADDRAAIVVFGSNALVERAPSDSRNLGRINSVPRATRTNIEDAIQLGLALFPAETQKRLVLLSDGGENSGRAVTAARLAAARDVPIDIVDLSTVTDGVDVLVAQLEAPTRVRDGQTATLRAVLESSTAQIVEARLVGDEGVIETRTLELEAGVTEISFTVAVSGSGFQRYRVQVEAVGDTRVQNNEAAALIQVQGPPRVLLVGNDPNDTTALRRALEAANIIAEPIAPEVMPADLAGLSAYDAVVLVNVPARSLPVPVMAALPSYVRDLGRGLLMIGGEDSYGTGGYGRTALEDALPVYMDVRNREERPDLALVFVIDKSGSMDACHCSSPDRTSQQLGSIAERKVDIAKEAVAQAAALLGPDDSIGVVSFDSRAVDTLAMTEGATVDQVIEAMAPVEPRGATNVRSGLIEAQAMLRTVDARIKHIILLTDGWGSGANQNDLAQQLRDEGVTLTVVAAGGGSAGYLEQLAAAGGGRYYPAQDMADVPQIFVQETITAVGNYIVERPVAPVIVSDSPILSGITATPLLYGYNGSTIKDSARLILATDDEQPLLATWQYGLGRSAAWLSDAKGQWAIDWIAWEGFPRFFSQVLGDILPIQGGQEISTEVTVAGGETIVRVATGANTPADLDVRATLIGSDGTRQELLLPQVGPGSYQGRLDNPAPGTYLVQIAGSDEERPVLQEVAGLVVPYSTEYRGGQGDPALLDDLANTTGGRTIASGTEAFEPGGAVVTRAQEIGLPLLLLALILLPIDIGVRRLLLRREDFGGIGTWFSRLRPAPAAAPPAQNDAFARLQAARERTRRVPPRTEATPQTETASPKPPAQPPAAAPPASSPPPAASDDNDPLARLREAKARARRRAGGDQRNE
jgi:uncharacterized membrane protein